MFIQSDDRIGEGYLEVREEKNIIIENYFREERDKFSVVSLYVLCQEERESPDRRQKKPGPEYRKWSRVSPVLALIRSEIV